MNKPSIIGTLFFALLLSSQIGCTNPEVPAGHEGYIYYTPLVLGKMEFRQNLRGPATTGISWRLSSVNIDMRAKSYKEDFELLTKENLTVSFEVNTRLGLRKGSVQDIVENWGGSQWYEWNVKERLRTIVREQVTEFSALQIQLRTSEVRQKIQDKLREQLELDPITKKSSPIIIESVDVGEIQFPKAVADAIERKSATEEELNRQRYILARTVEEANEKILNAIAEAKQQLTISATLDPLYVQYRAIQAYRKISKSNNQTTIVLPNSSEGTAMPLVLQPNSRRVFSMADKKRIDRELDQLEADLKTAAEAATANAESKLLESETLGDENLADDNLQNPLPIGNKADESKAEELKTPVTAPPAKDNAVKPNDAVPAKASKQ